MTTNEMRFMATRAKVHGSWVLLVAALVVMGGFRQAHAAVMLEIVALEGDVIDGRTLGALFSPCINNSGLVVFQAFFGAWSSES